MLSYYKLLYFFIEFFLIIIHRLAMEMTMTTITKRTRIPGGAPSSKPSYMALCLTAPHTSRIQNMFLVLLYTNVFLEHYTNVFRAL